LRVGEQPGQHGVREEPPQPSVIGRTAIARFDGWKTSHETAATALFGTFTSFQGYLAWFHFWGFHLRHLSVLHYVGARELRICPVHPS
jgi:hypothetical protein